MLNKKQNLKSGKNKDKERGFERIKKRGSQQKMRKDWWTKPLQLNILMLFFSWNKSKEQTKRKRKKQGTQRKQQIKTRRKEERKENEREKETEKEKVKKGEAKKG